VSWHHLLHRKQDKQHTVTLACSMFIIHVPFVSNFPHFCAEISSFLSASLRGVRQRVWNIRGVCHCRDVAQGSDRMISLYISRALLSLSNVVPMVHLSVEISTSVLALYPYNMVPTMVDRVVFLYEISLQRKSNAP
jgi:hypothetical protein